MVCEKRALRSEPALPLAPLTNTSHSPIPKITKNKHKMHLFYLHKKEWELFRNCFIPFSGFINMSICVLQCRSTYACILSRSCRDISFLVNSICSVKQHLEGSFFKILHHLNIWSVNIYRQSLLAFNLILEIDVVPGYAVTLMYTHALRSYQGFMCRKHSLFLSLSLFRSGNC